MNIVVLVKWVPAPQGTPQLGPDNRLVRAGVDGALDPGDEFGLEAAIGLVERDGGEVVAISMGPDEALPAVQRALAMGADRGVLITDDALAGADALGTARTLAAGVARGTYDLVIGSVESTDGYTGTVPATVAELLGLPSATFARRLEIIDDQVRIERQTANGYDIVECSLPALVTLTAGATEPRYPSLKGIMRAKSKPLERLNLADLGLDADAVTATQSVTSVIPAPAAEGGEVIDADEDAVARIADLLADAKVI